MGADQKGPARPEGHAGHRTHRQVPRRQGSGGRWTQPTGVQRLRCTVLAPLLVHAPGGMVGYLPSPPANGISIGPLRLHVYGLLIAARHRRGVWLSPSGDGSASAGRPGTMRHPGRVGRAGRADRRPALQPDHRYGQDTHGGTSGGSSPSGRAVWGSGAASSGGVATGLHRGPPPRVCAPRRCSTAWRPRFALAQAIGRLGQLLQPGALRQAAGLPWAVKIDNPSLPPGDPANRLSTFQPTFLYETIWDLAVRDAVLGRPATSACAGATSSPSTPGLHRRALLDRVPAHRPRPQVSARSG